MHDERAPDAMAVLRAAVETLGFDGFTVWLEYFALGGNADSATVAAWLGSGVTPPPRDYSLLAVVTNEALADRGLEPDVPWTP